MGDRSENLKRHANRYRSNTASKDAGVKSDPHTAADLDLFEAFLNSPRDPIQREIHVQEAVHQSCQHSARLAEDGGQERSRLGAEEDSLPENGRDENKSLGEHEDLENSESPVLQRKADPDKSIQLSFEPQLTGTAEQLKVSSIHNNHIALRISNPSYRKQQAYRPRSQRQDHLGLA